AQGIDGRADHAHAGRRRRGREKLRRAGRVADRRGDGGLGPGRHHRREPDPHPRGAQARRRIVRGGGARPRARRGRNGQQQHRRSDRLHPPRQGSRRRRLLGRVTLLQQADAGGAVPPLHRHRGRGGPAHHRLQHPPAQRGGHRARHPGAAGEAPEHRRREGRDGEPRPAAAHAARLRRRLHPALGRGPHGARFQRRRRPRLHQRHRQRGPAALRRDAARVAPGRGGGSDGHPGPAGAAARRVVLRNLARPGEIRRLAARQGHGAVPPAAGAGERRDARPGAGGDGGRGAAEL
ncbi:MAG: 4-hydroxy-tetrahydrodipicolinate synthase, partial [uncultured Acetobacteraceae bacterium]